jgi:hypothetical protein
MSTNNLVLDFTSPGAIPPDPADVIRQVISETQATIRTLESLLETEQVEDATGWKLLALYYLATDRISDLTKIENQYTNIFGTSLFADLRHKYPQWCGTASNLTRFEMPKKITSATFPDSLMIQDACHTVGGALLDFSQVQEVDNHGLAKLADLFSSFLQDSYKPQVQHLDHFITCLEKKANSSAGARAIWEVLFAYERFRNDREAFEEKAIRFAICYGISPPSWE